jgi:hypothetical protein
LSCVFPALPLEKPGSLVFLVVKIIQWSPHRWADRVVSMVSMNSCLFPFSASGSLALLPFWECKGNTFFLSSKCFLNYFIFNLHLSRSPLGARI